MNRSPIEALDAARREYAEAMAQATRAAGYAIAVQREGDQAEIDAALGRVRTDTAACVAAKARFDRMLGSPDTQAILAMLSR